MITLLRDMDRDTEPGLYKGTLTCFRDFRIVPAGSVGGQEAGGRGVTSPALPLKPPWWGGVLPGL